MTDLEKRAEEYAEGMAKYYESAHGSIPSQFEKYLRKAVEYGYRKANEWHYVTKEPLPRNTVIVECAKWALLLAYYINGNHVTLNNEVIKDILKWKEV